MDNMLRVSIGQVDIGMNPKILAQLARVKALIFEVESLLYEDHLWNAADVCSTNPLRSASLPCAVEELCKLICENDA